MIKNKYINDTDMLTEFYQLKETKSNLEISPAN